jgi:TonB-linked SusC/RagA family outer membrane protein
MKKNLLKDQSKYWRIGLFLLLTTLFCPIMSSAVPLNVNNRIKFYERKILVQQDVIVKGKVTDASTGQTMPSVSVLIKGSKSGTITDANGNFTISAPDNGTLVFSLVGYDVAEAAVKGQNFLNISLRAKSNSLNEVVVVGYGTQKKTSTTAAVSTIPIADIAQKPIVNITNGLVGRAAGLIATQGAGEPGFDGSGLLIRGPATTGRTAPLTVVDGVPRDFSRLDPNSIETITILKDAAAVAPYGVAGANGVILITTKSGKAGKPTLTYNGYYGIQNPTYVPRFVNSYQYALLRNEAAANDGTTKPYTQTDIDLFQNHQDPDGHADGHPLEDIILKNRPIQYHNISMSGGTEDVKYFASIGYNRQDGMWSTTFLNKYNGSLGVTANATKTTTVNLRVNAYEEDQHFPSVGAGSILDQAQRQNPTYPVRYSNGLAAGYIGQSLWSQIYDSGYTLNKNTAWLTQLSIDQKLPLKGLSLKGIVSYDIGPDPLGFSGNNNSLNRTWQTPMPFTNPVSPNGIFAPGTVYTYPISTAGVNKPRLSQTSNENKMMTFQGLLNYANTFGKSQVTGTLVAEYRKVRWQNFNASRINYNLSIDELNFGGPLPTDVTVSGSSGGQKQLGYVYRLTYAYNNRYLFETAGRYDGSYIFSLGNRFGFFPSFSAGWRISEEDFMKSVKWVNNLKLRGSYGQSGNYPSGGQYQYLSQFGINNNSAVIGGNATQSISENLQGNPNITWERAKKSDIALEGTLFNGLLGFETDFFYEKRSNFLVTIGAVLPGEYGVSTGQVNGGVLSNHGVEFTLTSYKNFANGLRLDVRGTFTYAKSKILQVFENTATYNNPNRRITGRPLGEQFGLKALGYYTPDDFENPTAQNPTLKAGVPVPNFGQVRVGDLKYADLSGPNGVPDGKVNSDDITDIGHSQTPQIQFGLEPRLSFKNFDLDLLFQGSARSNIQLYNYYVFPFLGSGSATEAVFLDHWTPENLNATYPRISATPSSNNTQTSNWFIRNDSYIRLKSAELGYTIPRSVLGKRISSVRVFTSAQNLFTVTPNMKEAIDPENNGNNQNYYQQRVISFGLNATF